jgi:Saxitoxin biosynthesis operon protein SxtJ
LAQSKLIGKKQCTEIAIISAMALIGAGIKTSSTSYFTYAFFALLMGLIIPIIYWPVAFVWFFLSGIIGRITSTFSLSVIYFIILVPVGMVMRIIGKDPLQLRKFRKSTKSAFTARNYIFRKDDIWYPY